MKERRVKGRRGEWKEGETKRVRSENETRIEREVEREGEGRRVGGGG